MMRARLVVPLVLVVAGGAAAAGSIRLYRAPGPLVSDRDVVVAHGGLEAVSRGLAGSGVIRHPLLFRLAALATFANGPLHAAELHFPAGASLEAVLSILRDARPVQHKVTIAEGLEAAQIALILARQGSLLEGDLRVPDEGSLLPETYVFERGTRVGTVTARARAAMREAVDAEWMRRASGLPLRTPDDAVTLASIVEHEARLPRERPMIARVFLNRIAMGMRLQADPTASYGAEGGLGVLGRRLDRGDLARADGYNTYVIGGLPVGPICSPGLATLRAVLHPAAGNALYFVADGTGGHVFSATLAEHSGNVARYRAGIDASHAGHPK